MERKFGDLLTDLMPTVLIIGFADRLKFDRFQMWHACVVQASVPVVPSIRGVQEQK
jgi:hypothetical protein